MNAERYLRVLVLMCATLVAAPTAQAVAQEDGDEEIDASAEFNEANRLASAGAITRSIPHYEKVLKAAPDKHPRAYYNLAEVFRVKDECKKAVLLYRAYRIQRPEGVKASGAQSGINKCSTSQGFGTMKVDVSPKKAKQTGQVIVDGYRIGGVEQVEKLELLPSEYDVEVSAETYDAEPQKAKIEEDQSATLDFELVKKLYKGEVLIEVDQDEADIAVEPRELESPRAEEKKLQIESPMKEPVSLPTGKYFLEVNKPGYDRWIRNIEVRRDDQTTVDVRMSKALPEAIRRE